MVDYWAALKGGWTVAMMGLKLVECLVAWSGVLKAEMKDQLLGLTLVGLTDEKMVVNWGKLMDLK